MAILLVIDTATEFASVGLYEQSNLIIKECNQDQRSHATFLQSAIQRILAQTRYSLNTIDGIAVTEGPGSYTGLRVGLASAKGIAYALDKPLLLIDTLLAMALSIKETQTNPPANALLCPMIDARRDEVFTAIFDQNLNYAKEAQSVKLSEYQFDDYLKDHSLLIAGSGSLKIKEYISAENVYTIDVQYSADQVNTLAQRKWIQQDISNLAYCQPNYLKAFYTTAKKINHLTN